jgi:HEAT repeat protein
LLAASSEDPVERRAALRVLCYFANPSALDIVIECARGSDDRLRDIAIAGLPLFDDSRVPELLLELSEAPVPRARAAAVRAMGHAAEDQRLLSRAVDALADADPWVRYFACQALGRWGQPAAADPLIQALQDPAGQVRVGAVDALAKLSDDRAREALSQAARSADLEVRRSALVALGSAPHTSFLAVLIEALDSDDAATRLVAVSSIARYTGSEPISAICRAALGDPDESVRDSAIELLASQSLAPGLEALLSLLWREPDSERVISALGRRIEGRVSALSAALHTADPRTASALVAALSRIDTAESRTALLAALQLPNPAARRAAAEALTATRSPDALEALVQAASHDPEPEVRRICALALP